ncbi:hypothetical protein SAMN05660359_01757 [Geodermatophilus obscurus]|uniref:Uncharacterized protein n=1 Tax=Geodermatophilus obscurus TaxID=1861 RepID=A0A1I5F0K7_9ACTN|nr:hypothetical protein [Geodermatophilus obscurus]SFO17285.1 hypothetical protein SAMN05660359_01757 [Geodermatophilus obscurus]
MSAPAPPAPSLHTPLATDDGLGIADLLDLLGLEPSADVRDDEPAAVLRPADAVAVVRGWVRRAADWGSGPQRSWCAW